MVPKAQERSGVPGSASRGVDDLLNGDAVLVRNTGAVVVLGLGGDDDVIE